MPRWLYFLLILAVVAPILHAVGGSQHVTAIFLFSTISLIPLAALIGKTTEDLSYYVGPIAGGLLNATFGNAPELIIGIFALQQGLIPIVKVSITGSIIGNALLVLGGSLALGGWRWGRQFFNNRDAGQYSAMLVMAVAGFLIPFVASFSLPAARIQTMSIGVAIVQLLVYVLYLALHIFHVRSRRRNPRKFRGLLTPPPPPVEEEADKRAHEEIAAVAGVVAPEDIGEPKPRHAWLTVLLLLLATIGTAWNSEMLVGTITPVAQQFGWSPLFIGLVIIPFVGNVAEHSSAMVLAYRDRIELSMAIAAGSSIQVATFVAPVLVFVSLFCAKPLDLVFSPLELVLLGIATILFRFISMDGETSWLGGMQLIAVYLMACIVFFLLPG